MFGDSILRSARITVSTRNFVLLHRSLRHLGTVAKLPRNAAQKVSFPIKQLNGITKLDANLAALVQSFMNFLRNTETTIQETDKTQHSLTSYVNDILLNLAHGAKDISMPPEAKSDCALLLVQWYSQEQSKQNLASTENPHNGRIPTNIVNSLLQVWLKHGAPAEKLVDTLGVRQEPLDIEQTKKLRIDYVSHPRKQLDMVSNISRRERRIARDQKQASEVAPFRYNAMRSYLWQQRGGLWLEDKSKLSSLDQKGSISALFKGKRGEDVSIHAASDVADLANTWLTKRSRISIDLHSPSKPNHTLRAIQDLPTRALLLAAPTSAHPLIDLPAGASPSLRLVSSLLREATNTLIYSDGVTIPAHSTLSPSFLPNNETFQLASRLSSSPADIHHLTAIAAWYKVPFHGPALSEAVKRLVYLKDGRGAHTLLQNTIASDNLNTFLKRKDSFQSALTEKEPQNDHTKNVSTASEPVKEFLRTLGSIQRTEEDLSQEGLHYLDKLEDHVLRTGELPLSLPPITNRSKVESLGLAYNSLVLALANNKQYAEAVLAWVALLDAGLTPSVAAVNAVFSSMQQLDMIPDVFSLASSVEAVRQSAIDKGSRAESAMHVSTIQDLYDPNGFTAPNRQDKDANVSLGAFAHHIHILTEAYSTTVNASNEYKTVSETLLSQCPNLPEDKIFIDANGDDNTMVAVIKSIIDASNTRKASESSLVNEKSNALFCGAVTAIGEVGDLEYLRLMFLRELSRVVLDQMARSENQMHTHLDNSVANTFVRTFAEAGDTKSALEVAKTALLFGAKLTPTTFYRLLESCTLKDSMDDAFRILDLQVHAGIVPTEETEKILMRCVLGWARDGAVVSSQIATVLDVQTRAQLSNPQLKPIISASRLSVLSDPALCDDVINILRGKNANKRLSREFLSSPNVPDIVPHTEDALATTSAKTNSLVNPMALAAESARVISTSVIRSTIQYMKSTIEENLEFLSRSSTSSPTMQALPSDISSASSLHIQEQSSTMGSRGPSSMYSLPMQSNEGDNEDHSLPTSVFPPPVASYDHYSSLFFPVSSMMQSSLEMLKLALNEWPVSEVLAMYRPSDDPKHPVRRTSKRYSSLLAKFEQPKLV